MPVSKPLIWAITIIAATILLRNLWPKTIEVPSAPRIVTQYDTVVRLDTAWVARIRHDTVRVNVTERITVTVPETLYRVPPLTGMVALSVGAKVGDSTLTSGFSVVPLDSGYQRRNWVVQFYTLGPVRSIALDTVPHITFYPPPGKPCGTLCRAGHYLIGGAVGFGVASLLRR